MDNQHLRSRMWSLAWVLFCLGFFTCTWDKLLTLETGKFTLKLHQLLFFGSFLSVFAAKPTTFISSAFVHLRRGFPVFVLLLVAYYALSAPRSYFPLKSVLYAGWVVFNLFTIWLTAQLLRERVAKPQFLSLVCVTIFFHAIVVLIDYAAYPFGFEGGFVGFNQAPQLNIPLSRPHAFSFEPSYIAAFFSMGVVLILPHLATYLPKRKWLFAPLVISLLALLCTTSRTGWFSLLFGAGIFFVIDWNLYQRFPLRKLKFGAAITAIVVCIFSLTIPSTQREIVDKKLLRGIPTGNDGSSASRFQSFQHAFTMARETSWLGTGLGASYVYWASLRGIQAPGVSDYVKGPDRFGAEAVMSTWGQLLAEGGLPALILFALAAYSLMRNCWRNWLITTDRYMLGAICAEITFFAIIALLIGNLARGDVWVWYALWSAFAIPPTESTA